MSRSSGKVILLSSIKTYKRDDVFLFNDELFNEKYVDDFICRYYRGRNEILGLYKAHRSAGKKYIVVKS